MRILQLGRDFPPHTRGGLSIALSELCVSLSRIGIAGTVLSFDDYRPRRTTATSEVPRTESWSSWTILRARDPLQVAKHLDSINREPPDLVHVHSELLFDTAETLRKHTGCRVLYSAHVLQDVQNQLRDVPKTHSSEAQALAMLRANQIHVPSRWAQRHVEHQSTTPIQTIPLGLRTFSADPFMSDVHGRENILSFVGRLADINGFAEFLLAARELLARDETLQVEVAGGLPGNTRSDNRWRSRWLELAGASSHRLRFHGWCDEKELGALYSRSRVIALPSWVETFGQCALEAMAHGAAVVTCSGSAVQEMHENAAAWIPPRDSAALTERCEALLSNDTYRQELAMRGRHSARRYENWSQVASAFAELYAQMLA